MEEERVAKRTWTKEEILGEAVKYSIRSEFTSRNRSAYIKPYREGWLDEISGFCTTSKDSRI